MHSRKDAIAMVHKLRSFLFTQREIRDVIRKEFPDISEKGLRAVVHVGLYGGDALINAFIEKKIATTDAIVLARIADMGVQHLAVRSLVALEPEDKES